MFDEQKQRTTTISGKLTSNAGSSTRMNRQVLPPTQQQNLVYRATSPTALASGHESAETETCLLAVTVGWINSRSYSFRRSKSLKHRPSGTVGWARATKVGTPRSIPGQVVPKTLKTVLVSCDLGLVSSLVLCWWIDARKQFARSVTCHCLDTSVAFVASKRSSVADHSLKNTASERECIYLQDFCDCGSYSRLTHGILPQNAQAKTALSGFDLWKFVPVLHPFPCFSWPMVCFLEPPEVA